MRRAEKPQLKAVELRSEILLVCEDIIQTNSDYCLMCLRTDKVRRLRASKSLQGLLGHMDKQAVWAWLGMPPESLRLCFVCEARAASALRTLESVRAAVGARRLLGHLRRYPADLQDIEDMLQGGASSGSPVRALALRCEEGLRAARRASACVRSATQLVTSERTPAAEGAQPAPVPDRPPQLNCRDPANRLKKPQSWTDPSNSIEPNSEDNILIKFDPELDLEDDPLGLSKSVQPPRQYSRASIAPQPSSKSVQPAFQMPHMLQPLMPSELVQPAPPPPSDIPMPEPILEIINVKEETVSEMETYVIEDDDDGAPQISRVLQQPASGAPQPAPAAHYVLPDVGGCAMLAVPTAAGAFALHQVVGGADGLLYAPSLPARIRDGHLEMLRPEDAAGAAAGLPTTDSLISQDTQPVTLGDVSDNTTFSLDPATPSLDSCGGGAGPGPGPAGPGILQPNAPAAKAAVPPPAPARRAAKRKRTGAAPASRSNAAARAAPPPPAPVARLKAGAIDWEDKIPDNVIAYADS